MKNSLRYLTCPECRSRVRIPWFWVFGIEGIFRCRECRTRFKTGYKMGAILSALGLSLALSVVQILVYALSIYMLLPAVLLIVPLWILFSFYLRKSYMMLKTRLRLKKAHRHDSTALPENTNATQE